MEGRDLFIGRRRGWTFCDVAEPVCRDDLECEDDVEMEDGRRLKVMVRSDSAFEWLDILLSGVSLLWLLERDLPVEGGSCSIS